LTRRSSLNIGGYIIVTDRDLAARALPEGSARIRVEFEASGRSDIAGKAG